MTKSIIKNVEPIRGISRMEFYKKVKEAINADSYADVERFINETKYKIEIEVDDDIIPHLRNCFTFSNKIEEDLLLENYFKKRNEKVQKAKIWFDTLTEEQKEFALLMFTPAAG